MVRYYSLIEVLPCPDLIINIVENLAYTPRSAFDVVSKFPLVEGSVIVYGLNPQGASIDRLKLGFESPIKIVVSFLLIGNSEQWLQNH